MPHNVMDDELPFTIDQMVQRRLASTGDEPILAYPSAGINYVDYTTRQVDNFAYHAAKHYATRMPQRSSSAQKPRVVALLGPSNLDYVVSMLALTKLGHTVLYLSPRISREAHVSLLQKTECRNLIVSEQFRTVAESVKQDLPDLQLDDFTGRDVYDQPLDPKQSTRMDHQLDPRRENPYVAWIIHSSGSTSLPKPVYLTHRAVINNYSAHNPNMKAYITVPLYHSHGVGSLFKTFYCGKQAHIYNSDLPLATKHLAGTMRQHKFEIVHGVPYSLKLLAESEEGVDLLASCDMVMYGGSPCPDTLGDLLVSRGVNLVSHYGTTETGQLMSSERPAGDKLWNWVRPSKRTKPFLQFEERGQGLLELVCMAGWPGKVMTNREDGSYATRDLFIKHPTMEAYKYFSRLDDTIVLVNGEKANPLTIEGAVRQQTGVREVVAFGHGKSRLGLMIVPARDVPSSDRDAFLDAIWPAVERSQSDMPAYAQLSKEMVTILPHNTEYPMTDKRTVIRQAFYRKFEPQIEAAYERIENVQGDLDLSLPDLKSFIRKEVQSITGGLRSDSIDDTTDFFALGLDSLHATQLRSSIVQRINLHGNKLGLNAVFDYPNIQALANKIDSFRTGAATAEMTTEEEMRHYIDKYGSFSERPRSSEQVRDNQSILLTGASGSLGAHILSRLLVLDGVKQVYCPVRAPSEGAARERVVQSLRSRMVYDELDASSLAKIRVLVGDLSKPGLGFDAEVLGSLSRDLTAVIHCAWSVNFNLRLSSFEKDCIAGTRHLIDICLQSAQGGRVPASFNFCSSVSTAEETKDGTIREALPPDFSYARHTGYAQSKLVCEHICLRAAEKTGVTCRVLRVGQLIGDTKHAIWNAQEAFPLIWQSARTIGALPRIPETPRWLPVDVAAQIVADVSLSEDAPSDVYNVTNHRVFNWTEDLLPKLRASRIADFEELHPREWVQRLRDSDTNPATNPPYKLLEFFAMRYGYDGEARVPSNWETGKAQKYSPALRDAPVIDQDLVNRQVNHFVTSCWVAGPNGASK